MPATATSRAVYGAVTAVLAALAVMATRPAQAGFDFGTLLPPGLVDGVYDVERGPDGLTYAWTRPVFTVRLDAIDRAGPWGLRLRMRAARPDGSEPELTTAVDGIVVDRSRLSAEFETRRVPLPPRASPGPTHITFTVTPAYVPAGDPRPLGAMVDWLAVERPPGVWWAASFRGWVVLVPVVLLAALTALVFGAPGILGGAALSGLAAWSLTRGLGPLVDWPVVSLTAAAVAAGGAVALVSAGRRLGAMLGVVAAVAVMLKLLILAHPDTPIGDAMFHAHRFQTVLAGNLLFTSITPGNYDFPYAPGLYVLSTPLAFLTETSLDKVWLLRIVTTVAEAVAAGAVGWWVGRGGQTGLAVTTAAVCHLLPLSMTVLVVGNLTNAFAQAAAALALAVMARSTGSRGSTVAAVALVLTALLSHTGTAVLLTTQLLAIGAWLAWKGADGSGPSGRWWMGVATVCALIATVAYYAHFWPVYETALTRAAAETGAAASTAGFRTPGQRLRDIPVLLSLYYSTAGVVLGMAGVWWWRRSGLASSDRVVVAAGGLVLAGFLLVGVITPIDFRHYLAAIPLVAIVIAIGTHALWSTGRLGQVAVACVWSVLVWSALRNALQGIGATD